MYTTFSQWLAAYLHARGVALTTQRVGGWTQYGVDLSDPDVRAVLREWREGQALVPARAYADAFRDVQRMARCA